MSLSVHIWSDVACPWCFLGFARLSAAASELGIELETQWHSYQLDPRPTFSLGSLGYVERLAEKYGVSQKRAQGMVDRMTETGAEQGIVFRFDRAIWANTEKAHRLLHMAKETSFGSQTELEKALFEAHFQNGGDIDDASLLLELVAQVGLDVDRASAVLQSDDFLAEVRADQAEARNLGITGVPFFVIGAYGVAGAQQPPTFVQVLEKALSEEEQDREASSPAAPFCGPEGC